MNNKIHDLRTFIDEKLPDLLLVQETKCKNISNPYLPGYLFYRQDGPQAAPSGGTEIFIKNSLSHVELFIPNIDYISNTIVKVTLSNQPPRIIASVYVPCETNRNFLNDLNKSLNLNNSVIMCGDFNAHHTNWNCKKKTVAGNALVHFAQCNNFEILAPPTPTRFGPSSATTIDLALIKIFSFNYEID
ncbi:hypothetical protein AVEN_13511-1 [Araneus ventricosus]|uniref:Endonuclease/exonuclease/phosphatase domain-containing protein n=1 Tax=Araneus ventricosus TaxID=182803 RepID=A0A4Y2VW43_ARAVE|nr:hypothetical protein AVEN_13511-1 [Araneus ventricosus]